MNEQDLASLPPDDPIDLLERPLFTVTADDGHRAAVSLAGLLARLGHGEPTELAYLLPHQQHVMHALCVQLAALVVARTGDERLEQTEMEWRDDLRALAGSAQAFQLFVSDLSKPAFMQPPVPEGTLDSFKTVETPDELDILVLAKNHDVKGSRIRAPRLEHWVFALVSLQTQQGFSGRDNYGIARMNGGFGNRPGLGIAGSLDWSGRFRRDVAMAVRARPALLADGMPYRADGLGLVWTEAWDGARSLPLTLLEPLFVEVCRRVRFVRAGASLVVRSISTKAPRIDAKDAKGNTGDLWTPVDRERGAALTIPGAGLPYGKMSELLFDDDWRRPPALEVRAEDGSSPRVLARALVRGQGKTEGLHERDIPVPARAKRLFATRDGIAKLGSVSKARIEAVRALRLKVLKPALCAYLQGGASDLKLDVARGDAWLDRFERTVDAEFFARLFADVDEAEEARDTRFETWLVELGREVLEHAMSSLPTASSRRERAVAAAEARFFGGVRKNFPRALARREPPTPSENDTP